ncbi:MAG TPA: cytochrome c oxidase subunit II [Stellaceae bacterium]|nr:cytochrome c oxidase subunit II [Stellaceae bacterium]
MAWLPFWPRDASTTAATVDAIAVSEFILIGLVLLLVFGMMFTFVIKYRQGSKADRSHLVRKTWWFEIGWTSATLLAFLVLFAFGARAYLFLYQPPKADLELYVVGKQWMWKVQYPGGQREIDSLHLPLGKTVRVLLGSEDVIHSFYIPAFRVKHDVVPGTYETFWFKPTELGSFRLECSEFCGTGHANMIGTVHVLTPADYTRWLSSQNAGQTLAQQGEALFRRYGCSGCHSARSTIHAPLLEGVYGSYVHLADGRTVFADERYIRDCILLPASQRVAGYPPVMPSFTGQIPEDGLMKLIAYVQSIGAAKETP